jgi:8-oxo-dGTP pyrophosphatase MutT (NUDIX family)
MTDQRWRVIDKRLVADRSPYARVYDLDLQLPEGKTITNWLQVDLPPFVTAFVVTAEGRIPFVRQYRQAVGDWLLELPAGHVDDGEGFEAAVARETLEETGYRADKWESLGRYVMDANRDCGWCHAFLGRGAVLAAPPDPGDLGEMTVHLLSIDEVREKWRAGYFVSAPTALVLGLALARL